jgi:hypothetical protein
MTDKQLLFRFRLGFTKVLDKKTNTIYRATKELGYKVMQIKINFLMMFIVVPIPLLYFYPASLDFKIVFAFFLYIFESITLFTLGRVMIKEKDLVYVVKEKTQ